MLSMEQSRMEELQDRGSLQVARVVASFVAHLACGNLRRKVRGGDKTWSMIHKFICIAFKSQR